MKKTLLFAMIILAIALFVSCGNAKTDEIEPISTQNESVSDLPESQAPVTDNRQKVIDFSLVRPDSASDDVKGAYKAINAFVKSYTGESLKMTTDFVRRGDEVDETQFEILLGNTNRSDSLSALDELTNSDNDYIIRKTENHIVIVGKDDNSLLYASKTFLDKYLGNSKKDGIIYVDTEINESGKVPDNIHVLSNLADVEILSVSLIDDDRNKVYSYGRIVKLEHNGENNGLLLATSQWSEYSFPIFKSEDDGETWTLLTKVTEQFNKNLVANWQPHLYELPNRVGDMPEGTLLLAGCTRDKGTSNITEMCIWKSLDLGKTWKEFTIVDKGNGLSDGMYEPFLICDKDGSLVCFYSDETEVSSSGGQRLVFKVSKDGVNWGEKKYCVAPKNKSLRPGMVTVADMGGNGYILTYEFINYPDCPAPGPVFYKTTDTLTDWKDPEDVGKQLTVGGSYTGCTPYCAWTKDGGEYGTVIAMGRFGSLDTTKMSDIYLSFDLGKTWCSFENPLPYGFKKGSDAVNAYSFGFFAGSDGTVYYINSVTPAKKMYQYTASDMKMAKFKITAFDQDAK